MRRAFFRRGRRVEVNGLDGIAALRLQRTEQGVRSAVREQSGKSIPRADRRRRDLVMTPDEVAAFERVDTPNPQPKPKVSQTDGA